MKNSQLSISLDMVNRHYSEPNRNRYESKYYWEELYTLIHAAGFSGIEIPFEPVWQFGGRSGVPMTTYSIETKYGDVARYKAYLKQCGIDHISAVTFDANLFVRNASLDFYFGASEHFAGQAIDFAAKLQAECMVMSPSAGVGRLAHYHANIEEQRESLFERTTEMMARLREKAQQAGVTLALKPEYWSLFSAPDVVAMAAQAQAQLAVNTAHLHLMHTPPANFIKQHANAIGYVQLTDTSLHSADAFKHTANPAFPTDQATQVFNDTGCGDLPLDSIVATLDQLAYEGQVSLCNHQTRDPMRALLRNRRFINALSVNEGAR